MHATKGGSPLLNEVIDLYKHDAVSPFWQKDGAEVGYYTQLNNIYIPTEAMIARYQLQKIEELQRQALRANQSASIESLNQLFRSGQINTLPANNQRDSELRINEAITEIVKTINSTYSTKTKDKTSGETQIKYDQLQTHLASLENALTQLQTQLNITSGAYQKHLDTIVHAMQACQLHNLSDGAITA